MSGEWLDTQNVPEAVRMLPWWQDFRVKAEADHQLAELAREARPLIDLVLREWIEDNAILHIPLARDWLARYDAIANEKGRMTTGEAGNAEAPWDGRWYAGPLGMISRYENFAWKNLTDAQAAELINAQAERIRELEAALTACFDAVQDESPRQVFSIATEALKNKSAQSIDTRSTQE